MDNIQWTNHSHVFENRENRLSLFCLPCGAPRKDLEDGGISGDTFFGMLRYVRRHKPRVVILENVYHAPWDKMSQYFSGVLPVDNLIGIEGRTRRSTTKMAKKTEDSKQERAFTFIWNGTSLVTEVVPRTVGVEVGARLLGIRNADQKTRPVPREVLPSASKAKPVKLDFMKVFKSMGIKSTDFLVFEAAAGPGYYARFVTMDSKLNWLPQTRMRRYLIAWQGPEFVGDAWQNLCQELQHNAEFPFTSYLLPNTDRRVILERKKLEQRADRAKNRVLSGHKRAEWPENCATRKRHYKVRQEEELGDKRCVTNWANRRRRHPPPGMWPEYAGALSDRECDLVDVNCLRMASQFRRDPLHHAYIWDLSQNCFMTKGDHRAGISNCITPGGELFVTHLGRPMLGFEKLLMQGIPAHRLLLGREQDSQLSDLAGNAMSVTVIGAAIVAALGAPHSDPKEAALALSKKGPKPQPTKLEPPLPVPEALAQLPSTGSASDSQEATDAMLEGLYDDLVSKRRRLDDTDEGALAVVKKASSNLDLVPLLAALPCARSTSVLCDCEAGGTVSSHAILSCSGCGHTICAGCLRRHDTGGHQYCAIPGLTRDCPVKFERRLRAEAPLRLQIAGLSAATKSNAEPAYWDFAERVCSGRDLCFESVTRGCDEWHLTFVTSRERGISAASLHIRLIGGCSLGEEPSLLCELFVNPHESRFQTLFERPVAQLHMSNKKKKQIWEVREPIDELVTLSIQGLGSSPSWRAEMGSTKHKYEWVHDTIQLEPSGLRFPIKGGCSTRGATSRL